MWIDPEEKKGISGLKANAGMGLVLAEAGMGPRDWQIEIGLHQSMEGRHGGKKTYGFGAGKAGLWSLVLIC